MVIAVSTAGGPEKVELVTKLALLNKYKGLVSKVIALDSEESPITKGYENLGVTFIKSPGFRDEGYLDFLEKVVKDYKVDYYMSIDTYEGILLSNAVNSREGLSGLKGSWSDVLADSIHLRKSTVLRVLKNYRETLDIEDSSRLAFDDLDALLTPEELAKGDAEEAFGEVIEHGYNKVVFKPDDSNGSRGLRVVDILMHETNVAQSRSPYIVPVDYLDFFQCYKEDIICTPFYEGQNYNIDCYKDRTGHLHFVGQKVLGNRWGQVLGSEFIVEGDSEYPIIKEWAEFISNALKLNKNFNFELSHDSVEDCLKLVEVNPRISAVIAQTMGSEVDLPYIQLMDAAMLEIPKGVLTKAINKSYLTTSTSR